MYRRLYNPNYDYGKENKRILRERTLHNRLAFYSNAHTSSSLLVSTYGGDRKKAKSHERDSLVWEKCLDESAKKKMEEIRKEEKEKSEKSKLDAEALEAAKKEVVLVENANLHIEENTEEHHTDKYDCTETSSNPQLVVRRGQEFKLTLTLQRPWNSKTDDLQLIFEIGEHPNFRKGTLAKIKVEEGNDTRYKDGDKKKWGARIVEQRGNDVTLAVYPSPYAVIGEWELVVRSIFNGPPKKMYDHNSIDDIIILLNPWCKDDQVFMEKTGDLDEYIDNESGLVFNGSSSDIGSKHWFYGQFQPGILDISLHLLRKANDYSISPKMSEPVYIARALSRILNDCDDNGVLSGRWDGKYKDGVRPTTWKGSVPILEQYYLNRAPVKYGQCWVFSHLLTTVARALGLPCRSVTNFSSAHDTDLSMTIDSYVDENGDEVDWKNRDSVWNFHVWNEVWMLRPDLDKQTKTQGAYDGWHAVDATPQELSESTFQCGPSPLAAIRNGEVHIGYDTKFIFAEVNADCCYWQDGNPPTLLKQLTNRVGKFISTKWPNGLDVDEYDGDDEGVRLDLTHLYKNEEGSIAERVAVEKATSQGYLAELLFTNVTGVEIDVIESKRPKLGEDFKVMMKVTNTSDEIRSVRLMSKVRPITYWGSVIRGKEVTSKTFSEEKLEPKESKTYELSVDNEQYMKVCDSDLSMRILALGRVRKFSEAVFTSEDIRVKCPKIEIKKLDGKVRRNESFEVEMKFINPLNKPLKNCELQIEGSIIVEDESFRCEHKVYKKDIRLIQPNETQTFKVKVKPSPKPSKSKERELSVGILSDELPDMEGHLLIKLH